MNNIFIVQFIFSKTNITFKCEQDCQEKEILIEKTTLHGFGRGWSGYNGRPWNSYFSSNIEERNCEKVEVCLFNEVILY